MTAPTDRDQTPRDRLADLMRRWMAGEVTAEDYFRAVEAHAAEAVEREVEHERARQREARAEFRRELRRRWFRWSR